MADGSGQGHQGVSQEIFLVLQVVNSFIFAFSGRTLGGSTSINGAAWTRGSKEQYDALSQLLETSDADMNWNFDSLFSYMKKAETFSAPNAQQKAKGANSIASYHGTSGPVQVTFPDLMYGGPQQPAFASAIQNATGIALCADLNGGNGNCVSYTPNNINWQDDDHRSSAADAYLTPVENDRPGWLTLINYQVTKILLSGSAPSVTATGVQFKKSDNSGDTFTASASKEVILAAGAIGSPQLLQLSGVGDPSILTPLGIDVKVNLPTVGRNLQEQTMNSVGHSAQSSFNSDGSGPSDCIAYPSLKELFAIGGGSNGSVTADQMSSHIMAMHPAWAQNQAVNGLSADALTTIFGIQAGLIVNDNVPVVELFADTGFPDAIGIDMWQLLPFSRGNVTITSTDVFTLPKVIVNYFSVDLDLAVQTAGARLARNVLNGQAYSSISSGEATPGTGVVPDDNGFGGSDAAWHKWIQAPSPNGFSAVSHPIGTAALMRRDLGGVVDAKLRVYDTKNLRVIDASVLPILISAHLSSPLYGIAEKAADIIKSGV
ncbi:glucose oxidase [Phellopilus nigrolimitatus]|nr:glucose oxidase [Phellopilus nigrolimitatus]